MKIPKQRPTTWGKLRLPAGRQVFPYGVFRAGEGRTIHSPRHQSSGWINVRPSAEDSSNPKTALIQKYGAGEGIRTLDLNLGKVALYR